MKLMGGRRSYRCETHFRSAGLNLNSFGECDCGSRKTDAARRRCPECASALGLCEACDLPTVEAEVRVHDHREDRNGLEYCGWCYDHDEDSQFYGPPQPMTHWPCFAVRCPSCGGEGQKAYPTSSGRSMRPGGMTITADVCDRCDGSGLR